MSKIIVVPQFQAKILCWGVVSVMLLLQSMSTLAATEHSELKGYVMRIQLTPAVCSLDKNKQKQRQCLEGYAMTISSLLPETAKLNCETSSSVKLSQIQNKVVARIMPNETAREQLWQDIGQCVPMNASQYFRTIIAFAEKLKIPTELSDGASRNMQKNQIKQEFIKLNPQLKPDAMRLTCQMANSKTLLTEIQICYQPNGQYKVCSPEVLSNCPAEFTIQGNY